MTTVIDLTAELAKLDDVARSHAAADDERGSGRYFCATALDRDGVHSRASFPEKAPGNGSWVGRRAGAYPRRQRDA